MLGEHLIKKLNLAHPYNPIFWPNTTPGGPKMGRILPWRVGDPNFILGNPIILHG